MEPKPLKWTYDLATSLFVCGGPYDPPCDPATQAIERYDRNPDPRTERWDGTVASKKRLATPAEIDAYDAAQADSQALGRVNSEKLVKALAIWTAGKLAVPLATARQEIVTILKGL